jgi:hypothetical protein
MFDEKLREFIRDADEMRADLDRNRDVYARLVLAMGVDLKNLYISCTPNIVLFSVAGDRDCLLRTLRTLRRENLRACTAPEEGKPQYLEEFTIRGEDGSAKPGAPKILLDFTSTVCRRIQIGSRLEQVPIYETVCGDAPTVDVPGAVSAMFNEPA